MHHTGKKEIKKEKEKKKVTKNSLQEESNPDLLNTLWPQMNAEVSDYT